MDSESKSYIPSRGFGDCYWCGAHMQRLEYCMCAVCNRVAESVPSKVQMVLNTPNLMKKIVGKTTVENIILEIRRFATRTERDFPRKGDLQRHWETMIDEVQSRISDSEIDEFIRKHRPDGDEDTENEGEITRNLAIERLLRFMLHVAIQQGAINMQQEISEKYCVVCGKKTSAEKHMLCLRCRDELILESPEMDNNTEKISTTPKGMATRDMVRNRRGR